MLRRRLMDAGLDAHAQDNLVALLREQCCATGVLPTDETLVLERNRDESGSWRIIVHSMLGGASTSPGQWRSGNGCSRYWGSNRR